MFNSVTFSRGSEDYKRGLTNDQLKTLCELTTEEHVIFDLDRQQRVHVELNGSHQHTRVLSEFLETQLKRQQELGVKWSSYGRSYISVEPTGSPGKYHISAKIGLNLFQERDHRCHTCIMSLNHTIRVYRTVTTVELREFLTKVNEVRGVILFDEGLLRSDD